MDDEGSLKANEGHGPRGHHMKAEVTHGHGDDGGRAESIRGEEASPSSSAPLGEDGTTHPPGGGSTLPGGGGGKASPAPESASLTHPQRVVMGIASALSRASDASKGMLRNLLKLRDSTAAAYILKNPKSSTMQPPEGTSHIDMDGGGPSASPALTGHPASTLPKHEASLTFQVTPHTTTANTAGPMSQSERIAHYSRMLNDLTGYTGVGCYSSLTSFSSFPRSPPSLSLGSDRGA